MLTITFGFSLWIVFMKFRSCSNLPGRLSDFLVTTITRISSGRYCLYGESSWGYNSTRVGSILLLSIFLRRSTMTRSAPPPPREEMKKRTLCLFIENSYPGNPPDMPLQLFSNRSLCLVLFSLERNFPRKNFSYPCFYK